MITRRSFIQSGFRNLVLGGLVVMSGVLIFRNMSEEETCDFDFLCKSCNKLKGCRLPEGIKFKEAK